MVFQSRQPYWVDRCRPARRWKTLGVLNSGDDLHVKVRVTHWVEESKLDKSEKLFKGKHSNCKLHFFENSMRCENCRKYENLEYNDLEVTLPEYLGTCTRNNKLFARSTVNWSIHLSNICQSSVLFDLQCSFSILFAEAGYADILFPWFHWVSTASTGLATATFMLQPSYHMSQN
jgi:hypothetical protein